MRSGPYLDLLLHLIITPEFLFREATFDLGPRNFSKSKKMQAALAEEDCGSNEQKQIRSHDAERESLFMPH